MTLLTCETVKLTLSLLPTVKDPITFKVLLYSGSLCQTNFTEYSYRPNILCLVYALKILSVFVRLYCYFGLTFIETFFAYAIA